MNPVSIKGLPSSSPNEKQGHLGDLNKKSDAELRELLQRQEGIMKTQRHILINLPDKGAKVQKMIDHLKEILSSREHQVEDATDLFERLSMSADDQNRSRTSNIDDKILRGIVNIPPEAATTIQDNRINAYEQVISRKMEKKSNFTTNHSIKAQHMSELSENSLLGKPELKETLTVKSPGKTLQQQPKDDTLKLKYRYDDSLENDVHTTKHHKVIGIDVREAIDLQMKQKKHLEDLQIKEASQKLADRFKVNMTSFNPDSQSQYRNPEENSDEIDSDDDNAQHDYPE
eukprot:GHVO01033642.1.p1 GENE.GHVO01033642.1~~GHVO01033642.1.p1  ORF type:complete len:287 (-),score=45.88 GHVO01033642.1:12-872(-)